MTSLINGENPLFSHWMKKYALEVSGLIHIGAHLAQERDFYKKCGYEPIFWIEAIPGIALKAKSLLEGFENQEIINAALWSSEGVELNLNITSGEAASSSLFSLHLHQSVHPNVVIEKRILIQTQTLDAVLINKDKYNTLVIDTQGSELEILKGGISTLENINQIVCEISIRELYKNAPKIKQLTEYLETLGFTLVAADINRTVGWGDGLFIRDEILNTQKIGKDSYEINYHGKKFTIGTFLRAALVKLHLYEVVTKTIGRR